MTGPHSWTASSPAGPKRALITGATSGIGAGYVRRLAGDGYELVLVARDADRLEQIQEQALRAGAPAAELLPADLTDAAQLELVAGRLRAAERPVSLLINNAGIGLGRGFLEVTETELRSQLELNVTAVMVLTRAVLPGLLARDHGAVINVASVAAFSPSPGATYSASKAWVLSFTEGLALALHGTGVRVQALCPGFVRTEFHQRAGIDMARTPAGWYVDLDLLVDTSLADLARNRVVSVPGTLYKVVTTLARLMPRGLSGALARRMELRRQPGR